MHVDDASPLEEKQKPEPKALELFGDEKFSKNIPQYKELITSKKYTAEHLINFLGTKAQLTADQKEAINQWEKDLDNA